MKREDIQRSAYCICNVFPVSDVRGRRGRPYGAAKWPRQTQSQNSRTHNAADGRVVRRRRSLPRRWQSGDWIGGMASLSLRSLQSETRKRPKDGRRNCPKCPFNSVGRRSEGDLNAAENEHLPIGQNRQRRDRDNETASFVRSALNGSDAENSGGRPDLNGARELAPLRRGGGADYGGDAGQGEGDRWGRVMTVLYCS